MRGRAVRDGGCRCDSRLQAETEARVGWLKWPGSGIGFTAGLEGRKGGANEAREVIWGSEPLAYHPELGR
jgi:hypothetical protein